MALITTGDGSHSLYSERYGVTYHSKYGAVTESAHVFIDAGLRYKAAVQREIALLEIGLGTGLNAFMTWLEAEKRNLLVRYTAIEAYPLTLKEVSVFNFAAQLRAPERHAGFLRLHRGAWDKEHRFSDQFVFTKHRVLLEDFHPAAGTFDLIYFDAFAPQAQPELWTETIFARLYEALNPEGVLVTYCAKGDVKRTLKKVGFEVERLQGPPGKREMTRGVRGE